MRRILLNLAFTVCSINLFAQGEIPVNMYTGSPGVFVPLTTISSHSLSESIGLSYNVNAVNSGSPYGVGWNLSGGGQISRSVRGLPDDFYGTDGRRGWLNVPTAYKVQRLTADNSTATCTDELSDQSVIAGYGYLYDTEPDLYSFSVGGFSGKFVFDSLGQVRTIPYQDISILPSINQTTKAITSWTIKTTSGVTHVLSDTCTTKKLIKKSDSQFNLTVFEREYNLYKTQTRFASAWLLSQTFSQSGDTLKYQYSLPADGKVGFGTNKNIQILDVPATSPILVFPAVTEIDTITHKLLSKVTSSTGMYATFDPEDGVMVYDPNRGTSGFRKFAFGYTMGMLTSVTESDANSCIQLPPYKFEYNGWPGIGIGSSSHDFWGYCNGFGNSVPVDNIPNSAYSSSTGTLMTNGAFALTSISGSDGIAPALPTHFPTIYVYPNEPANERYRIYRIPSYPGTEIIINGDANQVPDENAVLSGTLNRVIYPSGGESDFTFEINKYYDARTGTDQLGGGLRIKSITYFDGMNRQANIVKNFSYLDANGHSSGKLISRPSFVIPLWKQNTIYNNVIRKYTDLTGNAVWRDLTAVTDFDLSNGDDTQGSTVGYTMVTVTRPGSGKAVFEYKAPAAYGDGSTGSTSTDWSPTLTKFARPTPCQTMGVIPSAESYGYALFPNIEYDYERGLISRKTEFNEAGVKVRRTTTTYNYVFAPGATKPKKVTGLAYDRFANSDDATFLYGQYSLLTEAAKVISSESVTTYNENDTTRKSTTSSQYYYGSSNHRFVTRVERTIPDGTVYSTNFKYVQDYPFVTSSDTTVQMIYSLRNLNRTNTVIETWSNTKPAGGTEKTTGASLVVFRPFTVNRPLVKYQMAYRPSTPNANFTPSTYDVNNKFTPYGYSTNIPYGVYEKVNTVLEYDTYDLPITAMGESRVPSGTLLGYKKQLPVAQFSNAQTTGIAFSDFETTTISSFSESNNYYGKGRTGKKGIHPYATLTRTVTKAAGATNYILAYWAKPLSGQTSIAPQLTFKDTNGNVLSTLNPTPGTFNGSSDYQYFTNVIPVSSLPSTFQILIQGQTTAPSGSPILGSYNASLLPMVDDINFIPDFATISTTTYNVPFGPSAITDATGITVYSTYDSVGRTLSVSDQDHNIRKRFTYNANGQVLATSVVASLQSSSPLILGTPINFVATPNPCLTGVTYRWSFDNQNTFTPFSSSNTSPPYTYNSTGTKTVWLQVNGPNGAVNQPTPIQVTIASARNIAATITWTGIDGNGWATFTSHNDQTPGTIKSYQWQMRVKGTAGGWAPIGDGRSTYTAMLIRGISFDIKCTVTTTDNVTEDTNIITVWNELH